MLKKIFGNDEMKKELIVAKETIEVLEERLRVKEKYVRAAIDENNKFRNTILLLKEEIENLKNKLNQFARISRATESNLNILKELKDEGLSYSVIAKRMSEITNEKWSKSTVHHLLNK